MAAADQVAMVEANRITKTTNRSWYHPNPELRWWSVRCRAQTARATVVAAVARVAATAQITRRRMAGHPPSRTKRRKVGRTASAPSITATAHAPASDASRLKETAGRCREPRVIDWSQCSLILAKPAPGMTKRAKAHRTVKAPRSEE